MTSPCFSPSSFSDSSSVSSSHPKLPSALHDVIFRTHPDTKMALIDLIFKSNEAMERFKTESRLQGTALITLGDSPLCCFRIVSHLDHLVRTLLSVFGIYPSLGSYLCDALEKR